MSGFLLHKYKSGSDLQRGRDSMNEQGYWFPWKTDSGHLMLEGPWGTKEEAIKERERAKPFIEPPSKYGVPFYAESRKDAEEQANIHI